MRLIPVVLLAACIALTPNCLLRPLRSQGLLQPDAKDLVARSGGVLFKLGAFRIATHEVVRIDDGGKVFDIALDRKIAVNEQRYRLDTGPDLTLSATTVFDGSSVYRYVNETNQYTKQSTVKTSEELAGANIPGAGGEAETISAASVSRIVRQENLRIDGKVRACYVVESTFEKAVRNGMTLSNGHNTTWIDSERGMILRQISDRDSQSNGSSSVTRFHSELTVTSFDLAPIFAPDEFTFIAPIGAKQVDENPTKPQ
jgi:outer membrane lipoprotein-sorting protein